MSNRLDDSLLQRLSSAFHGDKAYATEGGREERKRQRERVETGAGEREDFQHASNYAQLWYCKAGLTDLHAPVFQDMFHPFTWSHLNWGQHLVMGQFVSSRPSQSI